MKDIRAVDKRAETQWDKSEISYKNYQNFLNKKENRFNLSLIDLLYISNFKGGNATINETEQKIEKKLVQYSDRLQDIFTAFGTLHLTELTNSQIDLLISKIESFCNLTNKGTENQIDGFSASYLSALLNSYFPNLIPILDRRVLINLELVTRNDIDKTGQIKNIRTFYNSLIRKTAELSKKELKSIREIDRQIFIMRIEDND